MTNMRYAAVQGHSLTVISFSTMAWFEFPNFHEFSKQHPCCGFSFRSSHFKKNFCYSLEYEKIIRGTISNFFIFWITVLLMGSPNNTFENLVFMKWWNGESFDTQKWQIHLGPPDDELIQLIFIFIMHLLMAIWWCVWLKFKNTGPLFIYIHSK